MKVFLFVLVFLLECKFFGALPISQLYPTLILIPFAFLSFFSKKTYFGNIILLFILSLIITAILCDLQRGQSLSLSLNRYARFYHLLIYFVLLYYSVTLKECEQILLIISTLFCICYIFQNWIYPVNIFLKDVSDLDNTDLTLGDIQSFVISGKARIRMMGQGFASLGYFYGFNKSIKKFNVGYIVFTCLCAYTIVLMGFRTMTFLVVVFSVILAYRYYKFSLKWVGSILIVLGLLYFFFINTEIGQNITEEMLARQKGDNNSLTENIRWRALNYFTTDHLKNISEVLFGSGFPAPPSSYYKQIGALQQKGLWLDDIGLIGLGVRIGIVGLFFIILYVWKVVTLKTDKEYYYLSIWFLYYLFASVTTCELYRPTNFLPQTLVLYSVYLLTMRNENETR
jgi:hypothetical protein